MSLPSKPRMRRTFPLGLDRVAFTAKTYVGAPRLAQASRATLAAGQAQRSSPQAADARKSAALQFQAHHASDLEGVRYKMVQRVRDLGLRDERVICALQQVPRHRFVDPGLQAQAYEDTSLPIGLGQTISKPSVVARMLELLCAGREVSMSRVLEIGTGCGYQAALLGRLARQVVSIERIGPLHRKAGELLALLRVTNLHLVHGDGRLGYEGLAPYDGIIAAAGGAQLPPAWLEQLAPGGRLVAPVQAAERGGQVLMMVERLHNGRFVHTTYEAVHFVPLKSGLT